MHQWNMQIKTMVSVSRLANNFTVLKTHGDRVRGDRIRGVTIMRYINLHFTYLLTYHFVDSTYSLQKQWRPAIPKYWQVANGIQDHIMLQIIKLWEFPLSTSLVQVLKFNKCNFFRSRMLLWFFIIFLTLPWPLSKSSTSQGFSRRSRFPDFSRVSQVL